MSVPQPFAHQKVSIQRLAKSPIIFDTSDPGCVSADTEFLTPTGWKRIDKYVKGDIVAQFHPQEREIEFVLPTEYVKRPCSTMIAIAPSRGTSQRLSHEHRVLYYTPEGNSQVVSAQEYAELLWRHGPNHFRAKFCTTFSVRSRTELELSDSQIRIMVAVIADGHFKSDVSNCCVIRLKKTRKIQRLHELLMVSGIIYAVRQCGGDPDFTVFTFDAPLHHKEFGDYWWEASQIQLEVIADELCYWDSAQDKRSSNGTRFSSFSEASANFAQYALSASKRPASLTYSVRDRHDENRGVMVEYTVHARDEDCMVGPGRKTSVYEVTNPEGFKYCFEVPSSFLLLRHNGYIFATGNTGKTPVQILDFAARRRKGGKCMLILATKSLLTSAWEGDFRKFAPDMKVSVAFAENRAKAFATPADAYATNHDAANWLAKQPASFFAKFDTLVVDESTAFKHHTSQRSKAVGQIIKHFKYRRLLTGTPNSNGVCDLWHQLYLLDNGQRLGKSFFAFRKAACDAVKIMDNPVYVVDKDSKGVPRRGPDGRVLMKAITPVNWVDKESIELTVAALIRDITIRNKFEDCVDIPPNHQYARSFKLSLAHLKAYETMRDDKLLQLRKTTVTAINAAAVAGKLLQIASGAVYDDNGEGAYSPIASERYELILDLVEEREHSIVFFNWVHQRDELIKEATKRGISFAVYDGTTSTRDRTAIVKDYQAGKYRVLFAHPQSAGHGLTLTKGTVTIWASPTYNLEHFLQGLKRVHRIGQDKKTETIVIVAEGTIDELVWQALQDKNVKLVELLEGLK